MQARRETERERKRERERERHKDLLRKTNIPHILPGPMEGHPDFRRADIELLQMRSRLRRTADVTLTGLTDSLVKDAAEGFELGAQED